MRGTKLTFEEIQAAEKAKDNRARQRSKGFNKMHERDAGSASLRNYHGAEAVMFWHITDDRKKEGVAYHSIPDGMFALKIGDEFAVFDAEEFKRSLRWA